MIPERTFGYSANTAMLSIDEYVYYIMDVSMSECRMFSKDMKPLKTIPLSLPTNGYLSDISNITRQLLNTDNAIELFYTYYQYTALTDTSGYYYYQTNIANEKGTILLHIPYCISYEIRHVAPQKVRLFCYCTDYSVYPYATWTLIYTIQDNIIQQEIALQKGWNLVSFYALPENRNIESALGNAITHIDEIKNFESAFVTGNAITSLNNLNYGNGYFVNANENATIYVSGKAYPDSAYAMRLSEGWNIKGIPFAKPQPLETLHIETLKDTINCIKSDNNHTDLAIPQFLWKINGLNAGQAYMIKANKPCNINMTID